jgi:Asp-tRNA(Asn)/Glu-tRNA(Gln) amidotransferase A subunit family amidase
MGIESEYDSADALSLAALVRRGEVKASELLDVAIARVEALNPRLNAVVHTMYDEARQAIDAGLPAGAFTGVPFLIKDLNAHVTGAPTTNGSRFFADYIPDHDAELVARYRRAGLLIFGKTNTPELGLNASTEPQLFGPTRNPWEPGHSAGGSSGGAAAAVASGMLPLAHASDGGGSIRIPASACGLFGLKPTRARNSYGPDVGEGWAGMSTAHAVSRSVRDSAALLDASSGPAPGDPYWAPPPARSFLEETSAEPGRLRIAMTLRPDADVPVDPDCVAAVEAAARLCESLGHIVETASPAYDAEAGGPARVSVIGANTAASVDDRARALGREPREDDLEPATAGLAALGRAVTGPQYAMATRTIHRITREIAPFFGTYDVLLTPTTSAPTPRLGVLDTMDPSAMGAELTRYIAFTALWNATGQPAMSVPLHWNADGLPVGVQFVGRFGDEATLLRLAAQLERAAPWAARRPPV